MLGFRKRKKDGNLIPNRRIDVRNDIYLGGYHKGDEEALVKYLNDLTVYRNTLNIPHPYQYEDAEWWISHISQERRRLGFQPNWSIRHTDDGLIGGIGMAINGDTIDNAQEIGYWLGSPYRRQGIMTACIRSLSNYCFDSFKEIDSLTAHIFPNNEASQSTIKKAGFTMMRLIDNHYKKGDRYISAYEFVLKRPK